MDELIQILDAYKWIIGAGLTISGIAWKIIVELRKIKETHIKEVRERTLMTDQKADRLQRRFEDTVRRCGIHIQDTEDLKEELKSLAGRLDTKLTQINGYGIENKHVNEALNAVAKKFDNLATTIGQINTTVAAMNVHVHDILENDRAQFRSINKLEQEVAVLKSKVSE